MKPVAIIGGTGIGSRLAALGGSPVLVPTEDGPLRARQLAVDGQTLFLIQRHSAGHKTPPHKINYKAIARGAKALGVSGVIASAAVGCLRAEWQVGTFVVCSDFLDFTFRRLTMWDRAVQHVDFTTPFDPAVRSAMISAAGKLGMAVQETGVYVNGDGPRYETPVEIEMYRKLGGDLVGMTAATEAIAFRELGVPYGCLAVVTNLAAGMGAEELGHGEVVEAMEAAGENAVKLFLEAARGLR
ncbi:MAG: MTAP family purine nucleoside phosphorylase [Chthonomonas sp.]|nr:MTAP family purine nucleoside phosphorylase [Chthonomonas sp.]